MNLIIDSSAFNPLTSEDFTIYLKNRIPSHAKWVRLKSVTFISTINIYIHYCRARITFKSIVTLSTPI